MNTCWDCQTEIPKGDFRCDLCVGKSLEKSQRRRRGLTEWEELKIQFYKSDKVWEDNIRSRKTTKGIVTYTNKRGQDVPLPSQPKQYWPKPRGGDL